MKKLSKENFKRLREAIEVAYPRRGMLLIFVREELGENLEAIVSPGSSLRDAVAELLVWAESRGRLRDVLIALQKDVGHPDVVLLCQQLIQPVRSRASTPRPSATPQGSAGGAPVSRRNVLEGALKWSGWGAAGLVVAVLANEWGRKTEAESPTAREISTPLQRFSDETVTVDASGNIVDRKTITAQYFTEMAANVGLDMVAIRGGRFLRGSLENEEGRNDNESPQQEVSVPGFFMGRYAVTQAQWKAVAQLPKVDRDLEADPSNFKGDRCPVEQVSWDDAQEFCARLSQVSGKLYRLPSEAEWEYACRAGTTTPFAFGETITTEIANYDGNSTYANAPTGGYREQTVDVGSFPPNAWGLYDMHGNVWEWCEDAGYDSYRGAPVDGSARVDNSTENKLLRGGSWYGIPRFCRSAFRDYGSRDFCLSNFGFRVLCVSPRIL
jgi:formylglycine-generating enzyme required for sulfatase activity